MAQQPQGNLPGEPGANPYFAQQNLTPTVNNQVSTQPQYLQQPPTAQATYYGGSVDPSQTIQQILQGFAPQVQSSQNALNSTLAASGLAGGPNVSAQEQLQGQLASGIAPSIANAIQFAQGENQQAGLSNTGAANQFTLQNLQDLMGTNQFNTETYNNQLNNILGLFANPYSQMQNASNSLALGGAQNFPVQQGAAQGASQFGQGLGSLFSTSSNPTDVLPQANL
jgi:hypothetical protein